MKLPFIFVTILLILVSGFVFLQCNALSPSSDSGGSGADFDSTQYYTKAQTDDKIREGRVIFYANEGTGNSITSVGYGGGVSWPNSSGCMGIILQVEVENTSGTDKYLQFAYGDSSSGGGNPLCFTVLNNEKKHLQAVIRINTYSAADRLWVNDTYTPSISGVTIKIMPIYWLKNIG